MAQRREPARQRARAELLAADAAERRIAVEDRARVREKCTSGRASLSSSTNTRIGAVLSRIARARARALPKVRLADHDVRDTGFRERRKVRVRERRRAALSITSTRNASRARVWRRSAAASAMRSTSRRGWCVHRLRRSRTRATIARPPCAAIPSARSSSRPVVARQLIPYFRHARMEITIVVDGDYAPMRRCPRRRSSSCATRGTRRSPRWRSPGTSAGSARTSSRSTSCRTPKSSIASASPRPQLAPRQPRRLRRSRLSVRTDERRQALQAVMTARFSYDARAGQAREAPPPPRA